MESSHTLINMGLDMEPTPMMPYKTHGAQPTRYAAGKRRAETYVHGLEQLPDLRGRANKRPQRALATRAQLASAERRRLKRRGQVEEIPRGKQNSSAWRVIQRIARVTTKRYRNNFKYANWWAQSTSRVPALL